MYLAPKYIRRRRDDLGLRLVDLGEQVGVSPQTVSLWELGQQQVNKKSWDALEHAIALPKPDRRARSLLYMHARIDSEGNHDPVTGPVGRRDFFKDRGKALTAAQFVRSFASSLTTPRLRDVFIIPVTPRYIAEDVPGGIQIDARASSVQAWCRYVYGIPLEAFDGTRFVPYESARFGEGFSVQ